MSEVKPFAAFDVDGTIFKSSLLEKVVTESIAAGIFPADPFNTAFANKKRWQRNNNEGVYQAYLHRLVETFTQQILGVPVESFTKVTNSMVAKNQDRMMAFPRKLIRELRASHYIMALSGSPQILVESFLAELGFDASYGTQFEIENERFTGEFKSIGNKALVLAGLAEQGVVSRTRSVAIGDTVSDISMLDYATNPIMFNATRTLTHFGKEFGWTKVIEVKDQITVLRHKKDLGAYTEVDMGDYLADLRSDSSPPNG